MDFNRKVVVFAGGLGGIGIETCKLLVKKPISHLVIWDVNASPEAVETLKSINPECQVRFIQFNIADKDSIKSAVEETVAETKLIDVLINGVGIFNEADLELSINVNLIGLIRTTYECLPYMDKRKFGRGGLILNIASVAGIEPFGVFVAYTVSKFGIVGFTRSLADPHYYNTTGVAVTAICPGLTRTPLLNQLKGTFEYSEPLIKIPDMENIQSAETCAENLVRVIEDNKNGSHWLIDRGTMTELEFKVYWDPKVMDN